MAVEQLAELCRERGIPSIERDTIVTNGRRSRSKPLLLRNEQRFELRCE
jgi:hypothetical protein